MLDIHLRRWRSYKKQGGIASSSTAGNMLFHMAQDRAFRVRSGNERGTILPITSQCTMCYFKVKQLNNVALKSELLSIQLTNTNVFIVLKHFYVNKELILCIKWKSCAQKVMDAPQFPENRPYQFSDMV